MKLYGSLTSPYVRKVRMVLIEKNLPHDFLETQPAPDNMTLAAANPLGKVPALELDSGELLIDSRLHVQYLDSLGAPQLIPDDDTRWAVLNWHELGNGICDAVVARMLEGRRQLSCRSAPFIQKQEDKIARALAWADTRVGDRAWLVGNSLGLADLAMATALAYIDLRYPHDWRQRHPALAQWLLGMAGRDSFVATAPPAGA